MVAWYQKNIPNPDTNPRVQSLGCVSDSWGQKGKISRSQSGWETGAGLDNMDSKTLAKNPASAHNANPELQATHEFRLRVTIYIPSQTDKVRPIKFA